MFKIHQFTFNPFSEHTYVIYDQDSKDGIVIDPGMLQPYEQEEFDRYVDSEGIRLGIVVNTHMHVDHCLGNNYVAQKYGTKVAAAAAEFPLGRNADTQARFFGLGLQGYDTEADTALTDGQQLSVGHGSLEVIAVPGHSPGGIALYCREGGWLVCGDTLFEGSVGRTDLPGGDHGTLLRNIRTRLMTLPDDTVVYPGHGPSTTIGRERASNPFLR